MSGHRRFVLSVFLFCLATSPALAARSVELGLDMGAEHLRANGSSYWIVSLPFGTGSVGYQPGFRFGLPVGERMSVEPALGFVYQDGEGESESEVRFSMSLITDLTQGKGKSTPYIKVTGGGLHVSGGSSSAAQMLIGGGIGVRVPLAERFADRFEVTYSRALETDTFSAVNVFDFRVGLSFFAGGDGN